MGPVEWPSLSPCAAQADPRAMREAGGSVFRTRLGAVLGPSGRGSRVAVLLVVVAILSLADLYMTLTHLMNFGMLEGNPVARLIMAYGSPVSLVLWKLVTAGFAIWIMFRFRRRATTELGAVFCAGVLVWLTCRWATYNEQVSRLTQDLQDSSVGAEPAWVTMTPGG